MAAAAAAAAEILSRCLGALGTAVHAVFFLLFQGPSSTCTYEEKEEAKSRGPCRYEA